MIENPLLKYGEAKEEIAFYDYFGSPVAVGEWYWMHDGNKIHPDNYRKYAVDLIIGDTQMATAEPEEKE